MLADLQISIKNINMDKLCISSYNCKGFGIGKVPMILDLMKDNNIVLLQETWLYTTQFNLFDHFFPYWNSFSVSSMNSCELLVGGLTILYNTLSCYTFTIYF